MARPATGQVIAPDGGRQPSWAIRFRAYGKRRFLTLGRSEDGWNRLRAECELRHILADVERGIWQPDEPGPVPPKLAAEPTFEEFATAWLRDGEPGWRPNTISDYRWALEVHLLPHFGGHRLAEITAEAVDRYRANKLREGRLAPNAVNKTLTRLAQILELAVEYGHIDRNPAKGRRRRAKCTEPRRSWVEPEQLGALLDAAEPCMRPGGVASLDRRIDFPCPVSQIRMSQKGTDKPSRPGAAPGTPSRNGKKPRFAAKSAIRTAI